MKAMILAAGRGERMRPLTDHTPKPLLVAGGKPLIVWHLERLAAAGFREIVINHAHLGEQIEQHWATVRSGAAHRLLARTAGRPGNRRRHRHRLAAARRRAFLVVNGDVYCDIDFGRFANFPLAGGHAHLVMVANPAHHTAATSASTANGRCRPRRPNLHLRRARRILPAFFAGVTRHIMKLRPCSTPPSPPAR
jgi:MurNAc alpha-1-phosphate uridylyltransferase